MRLFTRFPILALLCLLASPVFAQNILITYEKSDSLFVCGADTFFINIQNTATQTASGATLSVALPTGVTYLPGSATGAAEQNISNLAKPVFSLPNLAPGAAAVVTLLVTADCEAADALDAGQLFVANISVESPVGNASISTSGLVLQTGLLLIESVENELMSGEKGDTLLRKICIKNTRLGKIGNLHFEDEHKPGFELAVLGAASQTHTLELSTAEFDGSFFTAFGDGDEWLELGETACFTEEIVITSCGMPEFTSPSMLRVGWGCGGEVCRYDSLLVAIEIKKFSKNPLLYFNTTWNPPVNSCGGEPAVMKMKIKNSGGTDAQNILIDLQSDNIVQMGLDAGSFRLVRAGDTTAFAPNFSTDFTLPECGLVFQNYVSLSVPLVAVNDSVEVLFDAYTCVSECTESFASISGNYFYQKTCPVNGFVSGLLYFRADTTFRTEAYVGMDIGKCLQDGETYPFFYSVDSKRLLNPEGFLNVRLTLPLGLSWVDSCEAKLGGESPVALSVETLPNSSSVVTLSFALPLPADSLVMPFCLKYDCSPDIFCRESFGPVPDRGGSFTVYVPVGADTSCGVYTCFVYVNDLTYFTTSLDVPLACAIIHCDSTKVGLRKDCSPPDGGGDGGPGGGGPGSVFIWDFKTYRLNYGLADDDNNRYADDGAASAVAQADSLRRDRFLPGDTLRVEYAGNVVAGGGYHTFPRTIWHEITLSDMLGNTETDFFNTRHAQIPFTNYDSLEYLRNFIRVKYADGSEASCQLNDLSYRGDQHYFRISVINTKPSNDLDELVTQNHFYLASLTQLANGGCLPKATLDEGDSIFFYTDFAFKQNFKPLSNNFPDPPLVGFRTALDMTIGHYAWNEHPLRKSQYSGYKTYFTPNLFGIKPCENSIEVKRFRYAIRIARENMFPYEVRPLVRINDYRQTILPIFSVASVKLEYLFLQDSTLWLSDLALPFSATDSILDVDFDPVFDPPLDEGFMLRTNITFLPNCNFNQPDSSKQFVTFQYAPNFHTPETETDTFKNGIGFYVNSPRLALKTVDTILYVPTQDFELNFFLHNFNVSPSVNTWLAAVSPSGQVFDFKLFDPPQQVISPAATGIFQLADVTGFSQRPLRLTGKNKSCETDTLLLIYGWGCAPFTDLSQSGCGRDTLVIELRMQTPELELEVLHEPEVAVCDSSDYFEFEIYNANNGYAYDPYATVKLPPGLFVVPGSCQISYPAGSAFVPISDPAALSGNLYQWKISAIQAEIATNGLPGVEFDPQNTLRIRFKTYTECGFVSNTQVIYGTRGTEPCGRSTNVLNKPGEPLKINGLNPTYGVLLSLQPSGNTAAVCGGVQEFLVQLTLLGTPSAGDSVYVLLPQGVHYVAGSYFSGQNAPAGPPTVEAAGISLPLPANLSPGSIVSFRFLVSFDDSAGCIDYFMTAQTRVRTEVFCPATGTNCTVYAATGEAIWNLNLQHPELDFGNTEAALDGNELSIKLTINNIGQVSASGVSVQIWHDADGNGTVSPGDSLLQTFGNTQILIPAGGSYELTPLLTLDPAMLCDLLLVLPAAENCACADKILPLENLSVRQSQQEFCDFQAISIGVAEQTGFTYEWQPANGLACPTCATTDFTPPPGTPVGQPFDLVLEEKSQNCTVRHVFTLTFGTPPVSVAVNNPAICKGQNAVLTALPQGGENYQWSPNTGNLPNSQQVAVSPLLTTTYTLTVTFAGNCTQTASATVTVFQPDTTLLGSLSTCEGEPVDVLGNTTDVAGLYSKILKNGAGCDSVIYQNLDVLPRPQTEENLAFCKGDTLFVFDTLLTQGGQVCRSFPAANGCDSVHCIKVATWDLPVVSDPDTIFGSNNQPLVLNGPAGFQTYIWAPADPNCPNCQSITVPPDTGYVEYKLLVADANGCEDSVIYRIVFFPPCDAMRLNIPNAFTPNGDDVNDLFRVVPYEGLEVIGSMTIYNRWGQKVYENQGNVFWDGTIDGQLAASDVYVYRIDIICDGEPESIWGDVALLR